MFLYFKSNELVDGSELGSVVPNRATFEYSSFVSSIRRKPTNTASSSIRSKSSGIRSLHVFLRIELLWLGAPR